MLSGRNKLTPTPRPPCPRADLAARMCALCGRASSGRLGAAGGSMFRPSSSWIPKPVRRCAVGAIFQVAGGCWWAPPWLTQVCEADFCLFSESECTAPSSPVMIPLFVPLPPKKRKERKKARVPGAVRNVTLSLYLHCSFYSTGGSQSQERRDCILSLWLLRSFIIAHTEYILMDFL